MDTRYSIWFIKKYKTFFAQTVFIIVAFAILFNFRLVPAYSSAKVANPGFDSGRFVVTQLNSDSANQILTTQLNTDLIASGFEQNLGSYSKPWANVFGG